MIVVQKLMAGPDAPFVTQKVVVTRVPVVTSLEIYRGQIVDASIIVPRHWRIGSRQAAAGNRQNIILALAAETRNVGPIDGWAIPRQRWHEMIRVFQISDAFIESKIFADGARRAVYINVVPLSQNDIASRSESRGIVQTDGLRHNLTSKIRLEHPPRHINRITAVQIRRERNLAEIMR